MASPSWTVTIDTTYPRGASEIAEESIHRLLDSVEPYRGALNLGRHGQRGLAITVSVEDVELEESTFRSAAARGEAIVSEHLRTLGLDDVLVVHSIEVTGNDAHHSLHLLGSTVTG
jgi:hypothetical protein